MSCSNEIPTYIAQVNVIDEVLASLFGGMVSVGLMGVRKDCNG